MVNISNKYIALLKFKPCKTKKTMNLDEKALKENQRVTALAGIGWGCDEKFILMIQKGIYPYKHMHSWEKFEETKLPAKIAFYSKLYTKEINDNDYEHAQQSPMEECYFL